MHAYYAKELPIPPPTIMPPSPMFKSQEFFLPEELLPPKKRRHDQSSSSTPTLPQEFKIGESSPKSGLERHKEKIEEILNNLDELSLDRIENMEDNIEGLGKVQRMPPKRTSTYKAPTMTLVAIRQLVVDSVTAALEAQAANMANADNTNINLEPREAPVATKCSYKEFMSYQPFNFKCLEGVRLQGEVCYWALCKSVPKDYQQQCQGRSYMLRDRNAHENPNVVMDTFYNIELADGSLVSTNTIIQGVTLTLLNQPFKIDLMPIKLGSFDIVISMDWLSKYHAKIICDEKVVHIPINSETLIIQGDRSKTRQCLISCIKTERYISRGCQVFVAQVMEKKSDEKRLENIPVVREFLNVFPEDLPGLPPVRQVEFLIDLIPGTTPVARAPYRLAPFEMQELSDQLQELADEVLFDQVLRLRELLSYLSKRKTDLSECVSITKS
nr:reverse transcriptase domain-containing protein [Tanacetum cinerariifolium]